MKYPETKKSAGPTHEPVCPGRTGPCGPGLAIGYRHLKMEATDNPTWDMIRDALIHSVAVGGRSGPADEVSALMVAFLQRPP